jgi:hypothetical protein
MRRSTTRRLRRTQTRIGLYAFGISVAVHAVVLCGFSVRHTTRRARPQPPALLWLTQPQPAGLEPVVLATLLRPISADVTAPCAPAAPAWIAPVLDQPLPQAAAYAEDRPMAPAAVSAHATPAAAPAWQLIADGTLAHTLRQAWQRPGQNLVPPDGVAAGPCDVYIMIDYPSFARQVLVTRSSGNAQHDAAVLRALHTLPLPIPALVRATLTPMGLVSYSARVRVSCAAPE